MVDDESAEAAYAALKMVIVGLGEHVLELAARRSPPTAQERRLEMSRIAGAGRDLVLAADAAAMALTWGYAAPAPSESSQTSL